MLFLGFILYLSIINTHQSTSNYLEETSECTRNSTQIELKLLYFLVGTETFKELALRNHVFIDKSLLLREVFKDDTYLTIFYLPPKFAKTINLDMIRTFAEIQLDSNHSIVPREQTFAYNFFIFGKIINENDTVEGTLFNPPLISRHMDVIDEHLGQYPSINLNFDYVRTLTFNCTWGSFRNRVGDEFEKRRYLTSRISANESARFIQLCDYFNRSTWQVHSDFVDLPDAMIFLAEMTTKYFKKKPILYIDDYDAVLGSFLHNNYINEEEEQRVLTYFRLFFDTIFSRQDIWHRIFLTGTYSVHSNVISSLPGTKAIYHAFNNPLSHFFGFTEADIKTMWKYYPRLDDEQIQEMRDYYKGYQMGENYPIYNPACIMHYFTTKKLAILWPNQTEFKWFTYSLWGINQMRHVWLDLLSDRVEYISRPMEKFSLDDMWTLKNVLDFHLSTDFAHKYSHSLTSKEFNQALMYQVDDGYMTLANYQPENRDTLFTVRAANFEIQTAVYDQMKHSYKLYLRLNVDLAGNATAALHKYLFSRQRQQSFETLTRSFDKLFKKTYKLFERNASSIEDNPVNPIGRHIIDYVGLELKYQHNHKLDRNIANGFIATRLNVASVVVFNYNQLVQNEHILDQIDNYSHPWIDVDPQSINSSVTYMVIGVNNGTKISTRRYGAEPPIEIITTPPPFQLITSKQDRGRLGQILDKFSANEENSREEKTRNKKSSKTTRVTSPKTKKSKSRPQFQPKVTKALNTSLANETAVTIKSTLIHAHDLETNSTKNTTDIKSTPQSNPLITKTSEDLIMTQEITKFTSTVTKPTSFVTIEEISSTISTIFETSSLNLNFTPMKSSNDSYLNKAEFTRTIMNSDIEGRETHELPKSAKLGEIYTENNILDTITFTESSLTAVTRVTRSVPVEPTSSFANASEKITPEMTESTKTNSDTTLASSDPAQTTTITPGQEYNKKSKSGSKFTKPLTTNIEDSSTIQTNPSNLSEITTQADQATSQSVTKPSKTHSKGTRPFNNSTFSKKKGKNFNATAFVKGNVTKFTKFPRGNSTKFTKFPRGNSTKFTKFPRGNSTKFTKFAKGKQFGNRTTFTRAPTTTRSTTTESTVDTFFPTRRIWTRPSMIKRSRTGPRPPQKMTTVSRIKFLKLLFGVRGGGL